MKSEVFYVGIFLCLVLFPVIIKGNDLGEHLEKLNTYEEKWEFYFTSNVSKDSIEGLLFEPVSDRVRLELLLFLRFKQGTLIASLGSEAATTNVRALQIARELNLKLHQAMALRFLSSSSSLDAEADLSTSYAQSALEIAEDIEDFVLQGDIYNSLYLIYRQRESHLVAIQYFLKSVELTNEYAGPIRKNLNALALARVALNNRNYSLGEKTIANVDYDKLNVSYKKLYIKLMTSILRERDDEDSLNYYYGKLLASLPSGETYELIADDHEQKGNLELALEYYQKAAIFRELESAYSLVYSKIARIHQVSGQSDSAAYYLERSLRNAGAFNRINDIPSCYLDLANLYVNLNLWEKAKTNARKGYEVAITNDFTESLVELTDVLAMISAHDNDSAQAYLYLKENRKRSALISELKRDKLLKQLEVERELIMWSENQEREIANEIDKKNRAIAELTSENKLRALEVQQQENLKISLAIGSLLLVGLLLILWSRFNLKKKALKSISDKNNENLLLIKEVHHRVKNNLQIILTLLDAQTNSEEGNEQVNNKLIESQNRIKSMAIIHQNLYSSKNFVRVPSESYLTELIEHIKSSYSVNEDQVNFEIDLDNVEINMSMAVPLGLIVNELISNALKYAFNEIKEKNSVCIRFKWIRDKAKYKLEITDNGRGLPENFSIDTQQSFGLQLVRGLVLQLDGELKIERIQTGGAKFEIYMKEPPSE